MVLIGAFNAIVRYLDRLMGWSVSSNTWIELQWYLFAVIFLFASAYALREEAHVRVDVLFGRLSRRGRAWINVLGTVLFLIPFCVLIILLSLPAIQNSWAVMEQSPDPGGLPRYPIKTIVPIAFFLIGLQGLVLLIRESAFLRGSTADPARSETPASDGTLDGEHPPTQ
jgi:TRAP-type mannitol/chloroaromatic compound transport system permease small subunit